MAGNSNSAKGAMWDSNSKNTFRENVIMVTNGVRIVVTAGHLRIMVTTEGV